MAQAEATRRRTGALLVDCASGQARRQTTPRLAGRVPSTSGTFAACPRPPARSGGPMGRAAWVTRGRPATAVPRRRSPLWTFATRTSGAGPAASARNPEEFDTGFLAASLGRRRGGFIFGSAFQAPSGAAVGRGYFRRQPDIFW